MEKIVTVDLGIEYDKSKTVSPSLTGISSIVSEFPVVSAVEFSASVLSSFEQPTK